jgi:hypothetical protein
MGNYFNNNVNLNNNVNNENKIEKLNNNNNNNINNELIELIKKGDYINFKIMILEKGLNINSGTIYFFKYYNIKIVY